MTETKLTWHHPLCEGECFACLIERTIKKEYGEVGLRYLLKQINDAPVQQAEQEFTAEQQDRFATAFDEAFAKAGLPQKQTEQEPVAYVYNKDVAGLGMRKDVMFLKHVEFGSYLYAAPVHTVDLTDDEIEAIHGCPPAEWVRRFARAVITADREKNK